MKNDKEEFTVIDVNGKNKFLERKKKQKERQTNNIQQTNNIIKIQKSILRFTEIIKNQPKNI